MFAPSSRGLLGAEREDYRLIHVPSIVNSYFCLMVLYMIGCQEQ